MSALQNTSTYHARSFFSFKFTLVFWRGSENIAIRCVCTDICLVLQLKNYSAFWLNTELVATISQSPLTRIRFRSVEFLKEFISNGRESTWVVWLSTQRCSTQPDIHIRKLISNELVKVMPSDVILLAQNSVESYVLRHCVCPLIVTALPVVQISNSCICSIWNSL